MLKDILISMIIWVVVGCGNGSGVKRLDTRAVEKGHCFEMESIGR